MYHLEKKVEGQGESITLNNTAKTPFEIFKVEGNSVQEGEPTPENPVAIQNVEGNIDITVCNINLTNYLDWIAINTNVVITSKENDKIVATVGSDSYGLKDIVRTLKPNTSYTFYAPFEFTGVLGTQYGARVKIGDNYTSLAQNGLVNFTTDETGEVMLTVYVGFPYTGEDATITVTNIRLYEGTYTVSNIPDYVEYQSQTITFPLSEGQKLMKGDYLADDGIHHKRKQFEVDGTNLKVNDVIKYTNGLYYCKVSIPFTSIDFSDGYSTHFKWVKSGIAIGNCYVTGAGKGLVFILEDQNITTVEGANNWLIQQKQAGTPVKFECELAEEEIEPYTPEQQKVYNKINVLYSYDEVTNVFSNNEVGPILNVITYQRISEEIKQRLLNGKITRAYLKVLATETKSEMIINESNYLKDLIFEELRYVPDEGFIGGTVAKRVSGNFNNVDNSFSIQDREFELYIGVDLEDETTEYIKYGTYIVQKPEDNQVTDNTSFEALDYMIKLNLPWEDRMTYPCTLKQLFDDLVDQSGLSSKVVSFLNEDFIVENNQFKSGTTRRNVLKAIAQMAFNWSRVDENNNIVMDFEKKDTIDETLTVDNYYNFSKQEVYGPVNVIVLRNSQVEGENITIRDEESIAEYGETELVIADNPFAYNQAKRAELIEAGRILFGLTYTPMSMDMIGYIYLNCKDKIRATNLNNEKFDTYLLNHTIEYTGVVSDSMESPANTKTETKYQFTPDMIKQLKHTEFLIDKANQQIKAIIEEQTELSDKVSEIEINLEEIKLEVSDIENIAKYIEGNDSITLEECVAGPLLELHIYGNNTVFDQLYISDDLIISNDLIIYGDSRIEVINMPNGSQESSTKVYELGITDVLRQRGEIYDEYVLEKGQAKIIRKINKDGTIKEIPEEEIIGEYNIELLEGNNIIRIQNYNAKLKAKFAFKNDYTNIFATKVEMKSSITQTAEEINLEVRKKVDENEIISKINQSAEQIQINANKVSLERKRNKFN